MAEFIWTDELVLKAQLHLHAAFQNPNANNEGKWEGIAKELQKWKEKQMQPKYPEGILSFRDQFGLVYKKNSHNDKYVFDNNDLDSMLKSPNHTIHSAQGLIEPITIDDTVKFKGASMDNYGWQVRQIIINQNNELIAMGNDSQCELVSDLVKIKTEEKIYTLTDMKNCFAASRFQMHDTQLFYRDFDDMINQLKKQTNKK